MLVLHNRVFMTVDEWGVMPSYNISLPTGTTIGKRWKKGPHTWPEETKDDWWMGEYVEHTDHELVGILWRKIEVVNPVELEERTRCFQLGLTWQGK